MNTYQYYVPVGRGHVLPIGFPDALYNSSILAAKRAPSWSPVNVIQAPSILSRTCREDQARKYHETTVPSLRSRKPICVRILREDVSRARCLRGTNGKVLFSCFSTAPQMRLVTYQGSWNRVVISKPSFGVEKRTHPPLLDWEI